MLSKQIKVGKIYAVIMKGKPCPVRVDEQIGREWRCRNLRTKRPVRIKKPARFLHECDKTGKETITSEVKRAKAKKQTEYKVGQRTRAGTMIAAVMKGPNGRVQRLEVICQNCGNEREIAIQDAFQVRLCKECQRRKTGQRSGTKAKSVDWATKPKFTLTERLLDLRKEWRAAEEKAKLKPTRTLKRKAKEANDSLVAEFYRINPSADKAAYHYFLEW